MMKTFLLIAAMTAVGLVGGSAGAEAGQSVYPVHIERQRGSTLVIEHTPVPGTIGRRHLYRGTAVAGPRKIRRVRAAASRRSAYRRKITVRRVGYTYRGIAGGCRDGGLVRRVYAGTAVTLQREICEAIAPISSLP